MKLVDLRIVLLVLSDVMWQHLLSQDIYGALKLLSKILVLLSAEHAQLDFVHKWAHNREDQGHCWTLHRIDHMVGGLYVFCLLKFLGV